MASDSKLPFLQKELDNLNKKERRIKIAYMDGIDSLEEYKENKKLIETERDQITEKMKALTSEGEVNSLELKQQMLLRCRNTYDVLMSGADLEEKASAIRSICESITFNKDKKELEYVFYLR